MDVVVFVGPPGSGKGQQANILMKKGFHHLSTGDMLRDVLSDPQHRMHKLVAEPMANGQLVADDVIVGLVSESLKSLPKGSRVVLDGFPRTVGQAKVMIGLGIIPKVVVCLVCDDSVLKKRISGRWSDPKSGRIYNTFFSPPKKPGLDDITGDPLVQRADDKKEVVEKRLGVYYKDTQPLVDYIYELSFKETIKIVFIDAAEKVDPVSRVCAAIID